MRQGTLGSGVNEVGLFMSFLRVILCGAFTKYSTPAQGTARAQLSYFLFGHSVFGFHVNQGTIGGYFYGIRDVTFFTL